MNSAGSAVKENAAYIDSIQGRISQLKATFEDLSSDVVNSELFKFLINLLNSLLKGLDWIIEKTNAIPVPVAAAMVALRKMAGIKFENILTLDKFLKNKSSNSSLTSISTSQKNVTSKQTASGVADNIVSQAQKAINDSGSSAKVDIPVTVNTDTVKKTISNASEEVIDELQAKIDLIQKYFSDKANVKTNNSKERKSAEWHASENLKNDPNGDQELLDFVRGYEDVDKATEAFIEQQKAKIKGLTTNAQQAAEAINNISNNTVAEQIPNSDSSVSPAANDVDLNLSDTSQKIENVAEDLNDVTEAGSKAEASVEDMSDSIQEGLKQGSDFVEQAAEDIGDLSNGVENTGTAFKGLGTVASGVLKNLRIAAIATVIGMVISEIVEYVNDLIHATENAQKELENTIKDYEDFSSQLDEVNSQLEENAKKISEINSNPLSLTSSEDLKNLQDQNAALETQKTALETIVKLKAKGLESDVTELLTTGKYKVTEDEGVTTAATGNTSYLEAANQLFDSYNNNVEVLKNNGFSSIQDVIDYQKVTDEINTQQTHLATVVDYLTDQKEYLREDSYLYKEINDLITEITKKTSELDSITSTDFSHQLIDEYGKTVPDFENKLQEFQDNINSGKTREQNGDWSPVVEDLRVNNESIKPETVNTKLKEILESNNIELVEQNPFYSNLILESYDKTIEALKQINQLKKQGIEFDSESDKIIISELYAKAGLTDNEDINMVFDLQSQIDTYEYFKQYLKDNSIKISDIGADSYVAFAEGFKKAAETEGYDTEYIDRIFKSIFPDYQTAQGRGKQFIKNNSNSTLSHSVKRYLGGGATLPQNQEIAVLSQELEKLGVKAQDAEGYIIGLAQALAKERREVIKSANETAELEFIDNKNEFDEKYQSNQASFNNAIATAEEGSSLSYDDVWTLIGIDPTLIDKVTKSTEGYKISLDDLRKAQQKYQSETANAFKQSVIDSKKRLEELNENKRQATERLNNAAKNGDSGVLSTEIYNLREINKEIDIANKLLIENQLMYEEASSSVYNYTDQLEKAANKLSTFKSLHSSILEDISSIGRIGADNFIQLIEAFPEDWTSLITKSTDGTGFALDEQAFEQTVVKKLGFTGKDEKTIAEDLTKDLSDDLSVLSDKYNITYSKGKPLVEQLKEIRNNADQAGDTSSDFYTELDELDKKFEDIEPSALAFTEIIRTLLGAFKEDAALTEFNNSIDDLDYKLSTGQINQAQRDAGAAQASEAYKAAVYENGTLDDANTQKQIQQNDINNHSAQQTALKKELDQESQDLEDSYSHNLITAKEYYKRLSELKDEYYGKDHDTVAPDELQKLRDFEKEMQKTYGLGNVDLTKRPKVNAETMRKAGYEAEDGETATVYSSFDFMWQGDEENGKYVAVYYTPILPDGTVLDEKSLNDYINTLTGSDDFIKADTKGIILKVDTDIDVSEDDIKSLKTNKPTENIQNVIKTCDDWSVALHNVQGEWVDLDRTIQATSSTVSKGLLDDPDGTNIDDKNRELLDLREQLANDDKELIKEKYQKGEISFDDLEKQLGDNREYWLGGVKEFKKAYDDLEREDIAYLYQEEVDLEDKALERGDESNHQYAQNRINIWKKYYKDKDKYRKEDLEAERDAIDASKQDVQSQIDAFQHLIDKNNDVADGQINELQAQKERIEHEYDKQIKKLQKQKDLISDAVDKEDRRLKILEAQKELQKSTQSTRQVYGSDGFISYKPDTEKSDEAQKSYNDAITTEILNLIQDDIDTLENEKEEKTDPIDEKIYEIEQKRDKENSYLQAIVDMLGTILEDSYNIDSDYVSRLLNSDDAQAELDKINKEREQAGLDPISWADISSNIAASKEKINEEPTQKDKEDTLLNATQSNASVDLTQKDNNKNNDKTTDNSTDNDTDKTTVNSNKEDSDKKADNKTNGKKNDKLDQITEGLNQDGTVDINYWADKLQRLFDTPIPVTISDNVKKNIDEANQKVQSDASLINNTTSNTDSIAFNGDIVIQNPVGNSDDLAKELALNLPNAFQKQMYTNLK